MSQTQSAGIDSATLTANAAGHQRSWRDSARTLLTWIAVLTCVLAWWASRDLFLLSGGVDPSNPLLRMVCDPRADESANCTAIVNSSYARVPSRSGEGSTSWAVVGMGYFGFVGVWIGLMGLPRLRGFLWHIPLIALLAFSALASVFLLQTMAYTIGRWCPGCVLVHGMNGIVILSAATGFLLGFRSEALRPAARLGIASLIAALGVAWLPFPFAMAMQQGASSRALFSAYNTIVKDPEYVAWNHFRQPRLEIPESADLPSSGPADAPNTLVIFSDFQCPICRQAHDDVRKIVEKYPGALRIVYRHYPLDAACNPKERTMHPNACAAAQAAEAALICGGAEPARKFRELLFARQNELAIRQFSEWAAALSLDRTAFEKAMNSDAVNRRIADDIAVGKSLGVAVVPTLFLNGRKIDRPLTPESWNRILTPASSQSQPAK